MTDKALDGLSGPITLDQVVPARAPWDAIVRRGQTLRIVDLEGNQAVDFLMYALADDAERYSAQDTMAAQGNIFLKTGSVLLSNEGRAMATVWPSSSSRAAVRSTAARTSGSTGLSVRHGSIMRATRSEPGARSSSARNVPSWGWQT